MILLTNITNTDISYNVILLLTYTYITITIEKYFMTYISV